MGYPETKEWIVTQLGKVPRGQKIIDIGAGQCQYKRYCDHLEYTAQDSGSYVPGQCSEGSNDQTWSFDLIDVKSDITEIPFNDGSFDAVLCTDVLEHVPDAPAALLEMDRLLRPGGRLIITCPFCCLSHQTPHFHSSGYSKFFYQHHLKKYDLEIGHDGGYFSWMEQELRRINETWIRIYRRDLTAFEAEEIENVRHIMQSLARSDSVSHEFLTGGIWISGIKA